MVAARTASQIDSLVKALVASIGQRTPLAELQHDPTGGGGASGSPQVLELPLS